MRLLKFLALIVATQAWSQTKTPPKGKEALLNFEADVIEGEKRRPDLFLQTDVKNLSLDALVYLRKDMNDFHEVERKRRPVYFTRKKVR